MPDHHKPQSNDRAELVKIVFEEYESCAEPEDEQPQVPPGFAERIAWFSDREWARFILLAMARGYGIKETEKVLFRDGSKTGDVWRCFTGAHWEERRSTQIRQQLAELARTIPLGASHASDEMQYFHPSSKWTKRVLNELEIYWGGHAEPDTWHPESEEQRDPDLILPCANGLLDLSSGELLSPNPWYYSLGNNGIFYDSNAEPPKLFLSKLSEMLKDDERMIERVQMMGGYCLTRKTNLQKIFVLTGDPGAGKSTVITGVIDAMLGDHSVYTTDLTGGTRKLAPANVQHKRLLLLNETRDGGASIRSTLVSEMLAISGEDKVETRESRRGPESVKLRAKIILTANRMPRFVDDSGAFDRRIVPIHVIKPTKLPDGGDRPVDTSLGESLRSEYARILKWFADGYRILVSREDNFAVTTRETSQVRAQINSVRGFFTDHCESDQSSSTSKGDLYSAYLFYCASRNIPPVGSDGVFFRDLYAIAPSVTRGERKIAGKTTHQLNGLKIVNLKKVRPPNSGEKQTGSSKPIKPKAYEAVERTPQG